MHDLLNELLASRLLAEADWRELPREAQCELTLETETSALLRRLVEHRLLTPYQAGRIEAGTRSGLVLGSYRVLDRLGTGSQGVVFRGEHVLLRTPVAIKVLSGTQEKAGWRHLGRLAAVRHPGLVPLLDAGDTRELRYLVREFVPGPDLETYVHGRGLMPLSQAIDVVQQVALALAELHAHGLLHGRLQPANVLVTPEGQARLLDTDPVQRREADQPQRDRLDWLAPEQLRPGSILDEGTDLYALGLLLFWCLVGEPPFGGCRTTAEALRVRQEYLPALHDIDPDIPASLDTLLRRLLARQPTDRPGSAHEVADALLAVLQVAPSPRREMRPRVLLATARAETLSLVDAVLGLEGIEHEEACEWSQTLAALSGQPFDLVMLASRLPGVSGPELCHRVRAVTGAGVPLLILCEPGSPDEAETLHGAGADDVLSLPLGVGQLQRRVRLLLRVKAAQDRALAFQQAVLQADRSPVGGEECRASVDALVMLLSLAAQDRTAAASCRGPRLQRYVRLFAQDLPAAFVEELVRAAPLVDLGLLLVPDEVLLNDDPLLSRHDVLTRCQTTEAARLLRVVCRHHRGAWGLLQTALDVVEHHQERDDGRGEPARLRGGAIPLAARLVAPCLAYDNLRTARRHRTGLTHQAALEVLDQTWQGAFDPGLKESFFRAAMGFTQ